MLNNSMKKYFFSLLLMFVLKNGLSSFCVNCAPAVKKTDITGGF
jgi:hypothetical protein